MGDYTRAYDGEGYGFVVADAKRLADKLRTEATITAGVIRWNSNNAVPPDDCVALASHIGLPVDVAACDAARDADTTAFLTEYRKQQSRRRVSAEERAEMRAAFGPGARVINVITGRVTRL